MSSDFDIAIVGGGTMGLSAACYAAAAGHRTVLCEQFDFYNDRGSSDGDSRMFRVMYSDPNLARLAETSLGLWHEIENASGAALLLRQGLLFYGLAGESVEGDLEQSQKVMTALGIPFQRFEREALLAAYPVFRDLPPKYFGLSQPTGASIVVQKSLRLFHGMAEKKGATLLGRCPAKIRKALPGAGEFVLDTPQGAFSAKHLILAPGAWSNHVLAPMGIQLNLK